MVACSCQHRGLFNRGGLIVDPFAAPLKSFEASWKDQVKLCFVH